MLDEPTSALDPDNKKSLETLLLELQLKGKTIAISSHDMPFIRNISNAIYFMENGQLVEAWDENSNLIEGSTKIFQFINADSRQWTKRPTVY